MKAGVRLAVYGAGLVVAFGAAFGIAKAVVPGSVVASWEQRAADSHGADHDAGSGPDSHDAHSDDADGHAADGHAADGLSLSADGYVLSPVEVPGVAGTEGRLSFQIQGDDGAPVTEFATVHEQELHLIVVRTDGAQFRHEHPALDAATGTWSMPWRWDEAGAYRVYADFTPRAGDATGLTLSRIVDVAGRFEPVPALPRRTDEVAGFTVTLDGDLVAGAASELTATVTRDGAPVTTLAPYLGAFGHLVALRGGDLAYLHVHPTGDEPEPGAFSGPGVSFAAQVPTVGRYLLYLDFQVGGQVHTARFVVDALPPAAHDGAAAPHDTHSGAR